MKRTHAFLTLVLTALLLCAVFAVSAAAIEVKDGAIIGLDANKNYEYASVTLADYTVPSYTSAPAGTTKLEGLAPGIWFVKETSSDSKTALWIPGDEEKRETIGEVYYSDVYGKDVVRAANAKDALYFSPGVWTGTETRNHASFATYYLSATGAHVGSSVSSGIVAGTVSRTKVSSYIKDIVFKYAYTSDEIIPVEELYTMGFRVGVRQGSIIPQYSDDATDTMFKTKYVLYTMDETGAVTQHTVNYDTGYNNNGSGTSHSILVSNDFPDAKGWVVGIDVYPYGTIPSKGLTYTAVMSGGSYTNTCYFVEFQPKAYTTKSNSGNIEIPFQYNGANTAYIKGYGNGTFAPDADITKAEVATIIARILTDGVIPSGIPTSFADINIGDWYYDAVTYLENKSVFNYIDGAKLEPGAKITRGELAQIIYATAKTESTSATAFKDVTSSNPYYEAICSLEANGIIKGYEDKTFRPDDTITRAEAVTIINRMLNLVANESTVSEELLETSFNDIHNHWAKYQILMASNNDVKSDHHLNASVSGLLETDTTVSIENNHVKIVINKHNGKVTSIVNKADNTEALAASSTPWFTYVTTHSGISFYPKNITVKDNRLEVTYVNNAKAYFIIDVKDNYFTIELDSELPFNVKRIYFGVLNISNEFTEDENSYRISAVAMNANTNSTNYPGGKAKATAAFAAQKFGCIGAKLGITYSVYGGRVEGEHRAYLKEIVDAIDESVGTASKAGGAYALDNPDLVGDYIIPSSGISISTAQSIADAMEEYDINQIDIHQGGSTFIQGDFNFVCAKASGETFTTAKQFYERVGSVITSKGGQMGLHTYSSLVSPNATNILSTPKWQQDLIYQKDYVLTLASDITASSTTFNTNEDASGLILVGETGGGGTSTMPWSGPNTNYFLIDEEIFRVTSVNSSGLVIASRGACGTTKASHKAGAEIRHLYAHYGMFQPTPGSDLFYHIADLTAQAYNDGGFEMIYLDGLESFARSAFIDTEDSWYYYSTFIQRVVSGCEIDPIIEGSNILTSFWTSRGRAGAVDNATRQYKKYNYNHAIYNINNYFNYFYQSTLGWFNYGPDVSQAYKNTFRKTLFIDDIDHMGSLGLAFNLSTVYNHQFTEFTNYPTIGKNSKYHSLYSRLRKGGYFSDTVKKTLQDGFLAGKEYKVEEQADGTWAFREMKYVKNRIFDMADNTFVTGSANNPYNAQTPYIRIEQRYSTLGANEQVVYTFDETTDITAGKRTFTPISLTSTQAFKIKVTGNGKAGSAILLTLGSAATSEAGRLDFFIPTHFTGTREFILIDMDNADYDGYTFSGISISQTNYEAYRNSFFYANANSVKVTLAGDCTGVKIDDLRACTVAPAPATNPSVTIGGSTITFKTTVRSGEYIEYFPELGKAYLHSYNMLSGGTNGNTATVSEISFTGSVTVPAGDFTYTYNATGTTDAPLRAQVVLGLKSNELIKNESSWTAPTVELEEDIQYVTLK
ncbi:MAG: S-layer homology domain-containing protein [Ruminococcaceae bacterium]|nr:S-layer homology domain-containing protein [Oscillospiraceae bacterium]